MPFFYLKTQSLIASIPMANSNYSFPKSDRLCSHILIEKLFTQGKSFVSYPFRVVYLPTELPSETEAQVLFSVSKKKFKRAVHRNLLKRRCREAYRLNRNDFKEFLNNSNQQIAFACVYISGDKLRYSTIEKGIKKSLLKLQKELSQSSENEAN